MKISVCIPTYNRPDLIMKAVGSVLNQSYSNFELLIHDNSEDNLTEIQIKKLSDDRIKYQRHSTNIGMVGNWNSLLKNANCNYVKFLNDDDQLLPGCLSKIVNAIIEIEKTHGQIGGLSCKARYVDENGNLIKLDRPRLGGETDYIIDKKDAAYLWCLSELGVRTPTHMVYNKSIADEVGGFDDDLAYARDVNLALKLATIAGVAILDTEPMVQFTNHSGQDVHGVSIETRLSDQLKVTNWAYDRIGATHKIRGLKAIQGEICLREFALMVRGMRIRDAYSAIRAYFREGSLLSILCFIENNTRFIQKFNLKEKGELLKTLPPIH